MSEKLDNPWQRFKPVAGRRGQLALAAAVWLLVGAALLVIAFCFLSIHSYWYLALIGVLLGLLKGKLVLDRVAARNIEHIMSRPAGSCLGGLYPWRTWIMIAAMVLLGRFLRHSTISRDILGVIYSAIGTGLVFSSRRMIAAFRGVKEND